MVKPLDDALAKWTEHSDVLYLIQPLPSGASTSSGVAKVHDPFRSDQSSGLPVVKKTKGQKKKEQKARAAEKNKPGGGSARPGQAATNKGGGGAAKGGRGKGGGSGLSIPSGCCGRTADGRSICYAYNDRGCSGAAAGESCNRGFHVCGVKGCGGNHPMTACTKA